MITCTRYGNVRSLLYRSGTVRYDAPSNPTPTWTTGPRYRIGKTPRKSARVIRVLRPRLRAWASGCEGRLRSRTPTPRSKLAKLELRAPIFAGFFPIRTEAPPSMLGWDYRGQGGRAGVMSNEYNNSFKSAGAHLRLSRTYRLDKFSQRPITLGCSTFDLTENGTSSRYCVQYVQTFYYYVQNDAVFWGQT